MLPLVPVGVRGANTVNTGSDMNESTTGDSSRSAFTASQLVRASRTFFRMEVPLPPFLFEVPRVFGRFEALLSRLGAAESPQTSDYSMFIKELREECRDMPLNPNELNAVLRVVRLLLKSEAASGNIETQTRLASSKDQRDFIVPDSHGVLCSMSQCVARGNGWLDDRTGEILRRVDASRIRFVSSFITDLEIRAIGIVRLPDVIEEKLGGISQ